jgi:excisionase family DNA binding protein
VEKRLFFRPVEAAAALGISKSKIYELIAHGEIPSVRIGGILRVPAAALERLIAQAMANASSTDGQ